MAPEDIYNMDEIGSCYRVQPNKRLAQGKFCGRQIQTLALAINTTSTNKLKHVVIYKYNVTSVAQALDQGIIVSFKVQFENKLLEWVLT